jgi:hypothetical protein
MLDLWGWLKTLGKWAALAAQSAGMCWGNDTWNRMKQNETTWKPWNEVYSIINYVISYIINYIILKPPKHWRTQPSRTFEELDPPGGFTHSFSLMAIWAQISGNGSRFLLW